MFSICNRFLDRTIALHLSNNDETPNLFEKFLSYDFHFDEFTSLKSLSLDSIQSIELLTQIVVQCQSLRSLQRLKITNFTVYVFEEQGTRLMNSIWSLPLTHCYFENFHYNEEVFLHLQVISNTMNHLSIDGYDFNIDVLYHLFNYTPALRHLSFSCRCHADDEISNLRISSSIHSLKLNFQGSINALTVLFQHLPNLHSLSITITDVYLNGTEWERILLDYLPYVTKFRFRMIFSFSNGEDIEEQVDQFLETFRSDFWIKQHQWFVQCDWDTSDRSELIFAYTLSDDFSQLFYYDTSHSKSTHLNPIEYSVYDHTPNETIESTSRFSTIVDLQLMLPLDDHVCSSLSSLDQLKYLYVIIAEKSAYHQQLQMILDRAPNLYALTLRAQRNFNLDLMNISSASIRRLDLLGKSQYNLDYFDEKDCELLPESPIGKQCEVLLISVKTRTIISDLISKMSNLRSLTFLSKDDRCVHRESIPIVMINSLNGYSNIYHGNVQSFEINYNY